ncbi:hypothetical protein B5M42_009810 [Paenibacillus athensensis]|uniref:Uncharacterized protein n=1 Tax=Paenibacillus athensensis TaxID=1967502 RepID=A0A4Y8PQJ8_9BACL|nr:hypothetical protein [Paenibacillus athensensis]MCD1259133.1 hypothetical protein [Paenibacillus athensensis]
MESGSGSGKKEQREITYRVGWRKERIEQRGTNSSGVSEPYSPFADELEQAQRKLRLLWRPAPALPEAALLPLLVALPVLLFVLTVLLVYGLRSG